MLSHYFQQHGSHINPCRLIFQPNHISTQAAVGSVGPISLSLLLGCPQKKLLQVNVTTIFFDEPLSEYLGSNMGDNSDQALARYSTFQTPGIQRLKG